MAKLKILGNIERPVPSALLMPHEHAEQSKIGRLVS
jgi:hypothetical protein